MTRSALEKAVVAALADAGQSEMQWGVDDCALWAANIIRDALGYDPAKAFRGRYKTRNGARRLLGEAGLIGAMRKAARRHKWKRINPENARAGDMGLIWTTIEVRGKQVATLATVICRDKEWFVGRNELGFTGVRAKNVAAAWSVLDDALPGLRVAERPFGGRESPVRKEPVSIGAAILSYVGITGASAGLSLLVGSAAFMLTSFPISRNILIIPENP